MNRNSSGSMGGHPRLGSGLATVMAAALLLARPAAAIENGVDASGDCRLRCVGRVEVAVPLPEEPPWARGGTPWEWALEGSCVFIGDRRVLTARHVLAGDDGELRSPELIRFGFRRPDGSMVYASPLIIWDMELCPGQSDPERKYHDLAVALLPYDHGLEAAGITPVKIGALPAVGTSLAVTGWGANQVADGCALTGFGTLRSSLASLRSVPLYQALQGSCDPGSSNGFLLGRFRVGDDCMERLGPCLPLAGCPIGYGVPLSVDSGGGVFSSMPLGCEGCVGTELRVVGANSSSNFIVGEDRAMASAISVWNLVAPNLGLPQILSARDPDGDGEIDRAVGAAFLAAHQGDVCLGDFNGDGLADADDVADFLLPDPWFDYLRP